MTDLNGWRIGDDQDRYTALWHACGGVGERNTLVEYVDRGATLTEIHAMITAHVCGQDNDDD